ncbi:hydrogenase maturation nickel metallochaperone HypA [Bacillus sp. HMF5848]|uniref:hydrogenase maturation nickel metallochaperone HypA/HybF n=1 Tax=Bacillus sp. HMF5848 TaxID=2495421 RepID=UPI000F793A0F|nr:hydrogenase maturation nickel metallochaperone HypA [Bacillus sp. HMF5848]RSK27293.1 hydrogenase maturation nickel metallochaperone HypA [Bacillus sp. HMF5848]
MHEIALMGDILNLIEEDSENRGVKEIQTVELIVGDLSNALPDALQMAFDIFKAQKITRLTESAELIICREKALAACTICGLEYVPTHKLTECPTCKIPSGRLLQGETFQVRAYEGSS